MTSRPETTSPGRYGLAPLQLDDRTGRMPGGTGLARARSHTDSVVVPEIVLSPSSPTQGDDVQTLSRTSSDSQQRRPTMPLERRGSDSDSATTALQHVNHELDHSNSDDNTPLATPTMSQDVHTKRFSYLGSASELRDRTQYDEDTPTNTSLPSTVATDIEPVFEQLTIKTRAAPPPPANNSSSSGSGFSFGSLLPSISMPTFNLSLSNFVPRTLTSGPALTLVSDETREKGSADGSDSEGEQFDAEVDALEQVRTQRRAGPKVETASKWGVNLDIAAAQSPGPASDDTVRPNSPGTPSSQRPGATLIRTVSSAEFVAASQDSGIHPMTLHAIARRESEADALKLVRDWDRTERSRGSRADDFLEEENSDSDAEEGAPRRPPVLKRKESWSRGMFSLNGQPSLSRSESPTGSGTKTPRRLATTGALGSVREAEQAENDVRQTHQDLPQRRRNSVSSLGELAASSTLVESPVSTAMPYTIEASPVTSENGAGPSPTKKKGFFSRLSGGNRKGRAVSMSSLKSEVSAAPLATPPLSVNGNGFDLPATPTSTGKGDKGKDKSAIRMAKVKTRNKSHKDFGKLFLAQELVVNEAADANSTLPPPTPSKTSFSRDGADSASMHSQDDVSMHSNQDGQARHSKPSAAGPGRKKNAVWAIKFSEDGRYLAVGGKDGVVRVWEVLSTPEDRKKAAEAPLDPSAPLTSPTGSQFSAQSAPGATENPSAAPPAKLATKRKMTTESRSSANGATATKPGSVKVPCNVLPVFSRKPLHEYRGHSADVLDLSWSKNNFLLSSSMDKTVRLWHVSRPECLCAFQHLDFVTSIAFHPKDDRFFLSGSLDCKLRLWNIPEKRVQIWTELPELITAVAFTRDGNLAIAGSFVGVCMFFEVETFRYHSQFAAKSTRGKNAKGRKVTSMTPFPIPSSAGERLLVTSNDSRMRLYHLIDKVVEAKYSGHENTSSQIRASFSDDGRWVISGSEDGSVYIWDSGMAAKEDGKWSLSKPKNKDSVGYEYFSMPAHIITCATFAPTHIRETLAKSGDPVFGDGHTHYTPLTATLSGASLTNVDTGGSSIALAPVNTTTSVQSSPSADVIIAIADDETGVVSIFRNSDLPIELLPPSSSKKSKRASRLSSDQRR
ncbi:hypothetical protein OIV83_002709 [Microbotryomycetes sp. JL201]|nr:hypothetical protein OIV83_002709 [Microbotryomycetes sp. JL201]